MCFIIQLCQLLFQTGNFSLRALYGYILGAINLNGPIPLAINILLYLMQNSISY